jgi:hypothetical protein
MPATKTRRARKHTPKDAAELEQKRQEKQQQIAELHDKLTAKVEEIIASGDWEGWLSFAAKFHAYSFNNVMLILIQRPDATMVAGYKKWKDELGRQVQKDEKSIKIFAPSARKRYVEDPTMPGVKFDKNGKAFIPYTGFVLVPVFDISQTEGEDIGAAPPVEIESLTESLETDHEQDAWNAVEKTLINDGYAVQIGDARGAHGFTSYAERRVVISEDNAGLQQLKTLIHERAHTLLHEDVDYLGDRGRWEVEAESVAYIVMGALGLDSAKYSFGYVAGWSNGDIEIVRDTAERVMKTARTVLEQIGLS